jgi:hypothetical protein
MLRPWCLACRAAAPSRRGSRADHPSGRRSHPRRRSARPAYDGSGDQRTDLIPLIRYYGRPWFARTTQGVLEGGARWPLAQGVNVGVQIANVNSGLPPTGARITIRSALKSLLPSLQTIPLVHIRNPVAFLGRPRTICLAKRRNEHAGTFLRIIVASAAAAPGTVFGAVVTKNSVRLKLSRCGSRKSLRRAYNEARKDLVIEGNVPEIVRFHAAASQLNSPAGPRSPKVESYAARRWYRW